MSRLGDENTRGTPLADAAVSFLGFGAGEDNSRTGTTLEREFSKIRTLPVALLHVLILIAYEVEIFSDVFSDTRYRFILMQAILMAILVVSHIIFRYEHARVRYQGYLELYIKANNITRISFFWGANMTVLQSLIFVFHTNQDAYFNQTTVMEVIISIENMVLGVLAVMYIMLCYNHNTEKPSPDAALSESLPGSTNGNMSMDSSELLKKQAVMIQHLEEQVRALGEELLRQRQTTSKLQAQPALRSSRADDVEMLLVSKDQELRLLKSERDILRRDVQKSAEDMEALKQAVERLKKENAETNEQLSTQKKKFRQLTKDFTEAQIQLEVHKETNASAQKVIESLTTADDL